jgi:glycerophosphoryl diester phosphodiesterase
MHDNDVSTTTDGTGNLSDMTSTQVNALRINTGANVDKYTSDELAVPTVEKAIQIANCFGMNICFRIGNLPTAYDTQENIAIWDSFIDLIKSYDFKHGIFSGNVQQIQCLRNIVGENWEGSYFGTGTESADAIIGLLSGMTNVSVILQYASLTADGVKKLHKNGIKVYAYSTAPTNAELLNASDMGVDIFQNAYAYKLNMPNT